MSLHVITFSGGYVQASLIGKSWRIRAYLRRTLPSGNHYHTLAHTRVRRSESAALQAAIEMQAFWTQPMSLPGHDKVTEADRHARNQRAGFPTEGV